MGIKIRGIIFDMDNTLLRSSIDFQAMKQETFQFLLDKELLPEHFDVSNHTTSTMIEAALGTKRMDPEFVKELWDVPRKHEIAGMLGAGLEPGVTEILPKLKGKYYLTVVTNNAVDAAEAALRDNGILEYFDTLVGREMMESLKPSPDGFHYILNEFKDVPSEEWISVGDSWIDGKASAEVGIPFYAYQSDPQIMRRMGVTPAAEIQDIRQLLQYI